MPKADLHVHSCFSAHPSEWFLQRLGTRESYSEPETIYREARMRGMDFVTITDHNEIAASIQLKEKYPDSVLTGVEVTTYFPENGCKIHLLVYGLTESQFNLIEKLRTDIYQLRDYVKEQNLAHSVAHPSFSINKKLTLEYIERLFLLFDYFEGINGSRSRIGNEIFMDAISTLTPEKMDDLFGIYKIEPFSDTPWIKGLTGGSDDHSGLFIGKTYTHTKGDNLKSFVDELKKKESSPQGRHNDYQGLAFAIYKIAYEFSKAQSEALSSSLFNTINKLIFEDKSMGMKDRLLFKKMKRSKEAKQDRIKCLFYDLIDSFQTSKDLEVELKLSMVYEKISDIADEFFRLLIMGMEQDLNQGDIIGLIKRISGSIPGVFISIPFFSTIGLLHGSRSLLNELAQIYGSGKRRMRKRVLWFTDGISESHDVEATFRKLTALERGKDIDLLIVTALTEGENDTYNVYNLINLPTVYLYTPSFYPAYSLRFPSFLASLKIICEADPDEIFISTPGPVGLLGLLAARQLHVHCTGIYNDGLAHQVQEAIRDEKVCTFIEGFICWFYSFADVVAVPTPAHVDILEKRGYHREKMVAFNREDCMVMSQKATTYTEKSVRLPLFPSYL